MANPYINVYKDNPTAGAKDGTPVSVNGVYTAPITALLNKDRITNQIIKLAVRTEEGYETLNDFGIWVAKITDDGTQEAYTTDALKLSWTPTGEFKSALLTTDKIGSTNKIFYAKFSMTDDELPKIDKSMKFIIATSIIKVS